MVAVPSIRRSSLEQFGHSSSRASRLLKHATFFHIETKTRENELKSALVQNFILYRKLFFFFQRRISLFRSKVTRIEEGGERRTLFISVSIKDVRNEIEGFSNRRLFYLHRSFSSVAKEDISFRCCIVPTCGYFHPLNAPPTFERDYT